MKTKAEKSHRDKKNPQSREAYQEQRQKKNAERPKQIFNEQTKAWVRETT